MGRLEGRIVIAIVTGAASRLGLATPKRFAAEGVMADRREDEVRRAAALYLASGDSAFVTGNELLVDGGYAKV